ncbi:hypothetical protein K2Q02_01770 [Patescibacteria group bacterium]|nr:hypothetical protein [Patescibacteria group bacterium]
MDVFQSILATLKKKIDTQATRTDTIAEIVGTVLGMTVTSSMIICRGKELLLKLPPTARMKLTLKRQAILLALHEASIDIVSVR